jgi:hypothetical protein
MGSTGYPETSRSYTTFTLRHIPKERIHQFYSSESLKSHRLVYFVCYVFTYKFLFVFIDWHTTYSSKGLFFQKCTFSPELLVKTTCSLHAPVCELLDSELQIFYFGSSVWNLRHYSLESSLIVRNIYILINVTVVCFPHYAVLFSVTALLYTGFCRTPGNIVGVCDAWLKLRYG